MSNTALREIGRRLALTMAVRRVSVTDVAKALPVSVSTVHSYLSGARQMRTDRLLVIASVVMDADVCDEIGQITGWILDGKSGVAPEVLRRTEAVRYQAATTHTDIHEVSGRLRATRQYTKLSLESAAYELTSRDGKFPLTVLGSYERGQRRIGVLKLLTCADFYGVDPAWLVTGGCREMSAATE